MDLNTPRSSSVKVAQNIFDTLFVSTAMWATAIEFTRYPTYETFIWDFDKVKKERGKLRKQYYHNSRTEALKFHFRFCRFIAHKELKQKLPTDSGWSDFDY